MIGDPPEWLEDWGRQVGAKLEDGLREGPSFIAFARENGSVNHTYTVTAPDPFVAPAHSRRFWGMRLVLLCGPDGTVRDFDLVPADLPERQAAMALLQRQPIDGQLVICDKGFAGHEFEQAVQQLGALLLRPSRADEPDRAQPPIGWIRQRIESIVHSLKDQLLLERHGARTPDGILARVAARILALCTSISLNWQLGLPSRTLTPYTD